MDAGIRILLRGQRAPLVLAGVEYLFPIYREASGYPGLVDEGIAGNPEPLSPATLHRQAWSLLEPRFARAEEEAAARYRQLAGTGRTSMDVALIVPAAHQALTRGAAVHVVEPPRMPEPATAAAIFRY